MGDIKEKGRFIKKPYIGGKVGRLGRIKRDFGAGKIQDMDLYFLCVFMDKSNSMLEIIRPSQLQNIYYKALEYSIIGIAECENAAFGLVMEIFQDFCNDFENFSNDDFVYFKPWILEGYR